MSTTKYMCMYMYLPVEGGLGYPSLQKPSMSRYLYIHEYQQEHVYV
jgi:hypothetical protein